jgi:hypothetical protein
MNKQRNILNIALQVHMTTVGSYERSHTTGMTEQEADVQLLRERLANWRPSHLGSYAFDQACKSVVEAALKDYEQERGRIPR